MNSYFTKTTTTETSPRAEKKRLGIVFNFTDCTSCTVRKIQLSAFAKDSATKATSKTIKCMSWSKYKALYLYCKKRHRKFGFKKVLFASEQSTVSFWPGHMQGQGPGCRAVLLQGPRQGRTGLCPAGLTQPQGPGTEGPPPWATSSSPSISFDTFFFNLVVCTFLVNRSASTVQGISKRCSFARTKQPTFQQP